jgi:hypothetical protein
MLLFLQNDINMRKDVAKSPEKDLPVLFLIRVYQGHFLSNSLFNFEQMLRSLQKLENNNWEAMIVNTDVEDLPASVHDFLKIDPRLTLSPLKPDKPFDQWDAGYSITDKALDTLSVDKYKWLVVTNGDNRYESTFLSHLPSYPTAEGEEGGIDMIITNYWSRYVHYGAGLDRDPLEMNGTVCHTAKLQPGYIDLGGGIILLRRLNKDRLRFMQFGAVNSQDGFMLSMMSDHKWKVKHVKECLYSHSPNPYACYRLGGTWYTSAKSRAEMSDSCWSPKVVQAQQAKAQSTNTTLITGLSTTGIRFISLPPAEHALAQIAMQESHGRFAQEYAARVKLHRTPYCTWLQTKSRWKFNGAKYLSVSSNQDVQKEVSARKDPHKEAEMHFWTFGCGEGRNSGDNPKGYLQTRREKSTTEPAGSDDWTHTIDTRPRTRLRAMEEVDSSME